MGKRAVRRIAAGALCLLLILSTGCSGKDEARDSQKENLDKAAIEAGAEDANTETGADEKKQKTLEQASNPQFISNGIRRVTLVKEGEEFLCISHEPAEYKMDFDYWEVLEPYDENATMNTEVMFEMFDELSSLAFETPVQNEEGTDTGITESDTCIKVEYVDTVDDSAAKSMDEADTEAEIILGKEDGAGGRYAAIAGNEEQIYILPEAVIRMIYDRTPFDYILKIPALVSADTLKDVEIAVKGHKYNIQVDTASDSYMFGKKKAEKEEFSDLYQAISGIMLVSEIPDERSREDEEPEFTVNYHRNMENAPDIQVSYYAYDDEFYSVEVNGKTRFLVKKEDVETVIDQIEEIF